MLHQLQRPVEFPVQRAKGGAMRFDIERTTADPLDGIHGVNDLENGHIHGRADEGVSAMLAALSPDQTGATENLEDFKEIVNGNLRFAGDDLSGLGCGSMLGEYDHSPEGVLDGLGKHWEHYIMTSG